MSGIGIANEVWGLLWSIIEMKHGGFPASRFDSEAMSRWWDRGFHGTRMTALHRDYRVRCIMEMRKRRLDYSPHVYVHEWNVKICSAIFCLLCTQEQKLFKRDETNFIIYILIRNRWHIYNAITKAIANEKRFLLKEFSHARFWQIAGNGNFQSLSRRKFDRGAEEKSWIQEDRRSSKREGPFPAMLSSLPTRHDSWQHRPLLRILKRSSRSEEMSGRLVIRDSLGANSTVWLWSNHVNGLLPPERLWNCSA